MDDLDFTSEQKLKGVVSLFRCEAYQWWLMVKEGTQPDRLTWDYFKMAFQSKYVGASHIDARRREFLNLTQEDRTVAEYKAEFLRLSWYAGGEDRQELKRIECQNREKGKNKRELRPSSSGMRPKKMARVDGLVRVGPPVAPTGVVLCGCGSTKHRVRDCSLKTDQMQATGIGTTQPLRVVQQPPRDRGQARGGNGMGRGQRALGRSAGLTEVRQPALVYATRCRKDRDAPDVITDIGSTDSYVAYSVSETLRILVKSTDSEVTVLSSLGQSVQVSRLYKDVPLEVQGAAFLADVSLDCATKRVVLRIEEDNKVIVIGERRNYLKNVISVLVAEKLVRKGCEAFLAYVSISGSETLRLRISEL
ncbi:uncharacterized protein LOC128286828 [Gossypium arboreum]|uniref:uncharacterized protein LOC128286828 n=1 Tax=Gossypium arboreum TaxID=29729 RepID=UPI0022F1C98E|nr:uncharacterized protein LOC128286828 [Gossypium arboreum]